MSHPPQDDWDEHDVRGSAARFEDDVLGLRGEVHHDESLADEMLAPPPEPGTFRPRRRRRRNPAIRAGALILALAVVLVAGFYSFGAIRALLPDISFGGGQETAADYEGSGTGEVLIEIPEGAGGGQIAEILAGEDVVASASGFMAALQTEPRASSIQPGRYRMASQMSSQAAIARLLDGDYREINGVTVREGLWVDETFAVLAEGTGHEVADYEAVDPASLDLPAAADGDLEGFLFPSTYEFAPETSPAEQLQAMIDLGTQKYTELGIADEDLRDVIIKASIVQGEGMFAEDLPKIARVMENRLEPNEDTNGYLQMDSTVHFIYQERGLAGTTEEQRANPDPHNTYAHPGLPAGPIDSPGEDAIRAALNPEPGDWLYFVTVNPSTGETKFANNYEDHLENQDEFLQWCEENPDQC